MEPMGWKRMPFNPCTRIDKEKECGRARDREQEICRGRHTDIDIEKEKLNMEVLVSCFPLAKLLHLVCYLGCLCLSDGCALESLLILNS